MSVSVLFFPFSACTNFWRFPASENVGNLQHERNSRQQGRVELAGRRRRWQIPGAFAQHHKRRRIRLLFLRRLAEWGRPLRGRGRRWADAGGLRRAAHGQREGFAEEQDVFERSVARYRSVQLDLDEENHFEQSQAESVRAFFRRQAVSNERCDQQAAPTEENRPRKHGKSAMIGQFASFSRRLFQVLLKKIQAIKPFGLSKPKHLWEQKLVVLFTFRIKYLHLQKINEENAKRSSCIFDYFVRRNFLRVNVELFLIKQNLLGFSRWKKFFYFQVKKNFSSNRKCPKWKCLIFQHLCFWNFDVFSFNFNWPKMS